MYVYRHIHGSWVAMESPETAIENTFLMAPLGQLIIQFHMEKYVSVAKCRQERTQHFKRSVSYLKYKFMCIGLVHFCQQICSFQYYWVVKIGMLLTEAENKVFSNMHTFSSTALSLCDFQRWKTSMSLLKSFLDLERCKYVRHAVLISY